MKFNLLCIWIYKLFQFLLECHKFIRWADRNYPDWGEENDNGDLYESAYKEEVN